jgi:flagellar basal body-associated protein FliL
MFWHRKRSAVLKALVGFARKNIVPLAVVLLLAVEGMTMHFMMPASASETTSAVDEASPGTGRVEIPVGDYKVRNHQNPADDHIVKFSVCLMVDAADATKIQNAIKEHEQRAREAISIVARRAKPEILGEPTLATLKRRIGVAIKTAIHQAEGPEIDVLLPDFLVQKG